MRNPKLLVKSYLVALCCFSVDLPAVYAISYTPEFWGGKTLMTEYGNVFIVGDPSIKSVAKLEGIKARERGESNG